MKKKKAPALCPCGSSLSYEDCCGRFHAGEAAPDAVSLMRSRYSAFVKKDPAYLLRTWDPSTRPQSLTLDEPIKWLGLNILGSSQQGDQARVRFVARGKINGRAFTQSELSRFVRRNDQWYYLDGDLDEDAC